MSKREAAPLTAMLLARKSDASPSGLVQPQPAKAAPPVQSVQESASPPSAIDLTPPDFLRTEKRSLPSQAQKRRGGTT